ncbi:uncharacterized protein LOC115903709 [Camarhynchus parvulus]|uniref:uncharacterized protein LOC115903709 n=1 Tax=Geospiza parvula TaxID=87175 RepID=UPI001237BDEC|nr:uncharacterized protein LOC115903709 [Camarhynchus parvulus]
MLKAELGAARAASGTVSATSSARCARGAAGGRARGETDRRPLWLPEHRGHPQNTAGAALPAQPQQSPGTSRAGSGRRARIPGGGAALARRSVSARGRAAGSRPHTAAPRSRTRRRPLPAAVPGPKPIRSRAGSRSRAPSRSRCRLHPPDEGEAAPPGTPRQTPAGPERPIPAPAVASIARLRSASSRHRSRSGHRVQAGLCPVLTPISTPVRPRAATLPPGQREAAPPCERAPAGLGLTAPSPVATPPQRSGLRAVPATLGRGSRSAGRGSRDSGTGGGATACGHGMLQQDRDGGRGCRCRALLGSAEVPGVAACPLSGGWRRHRARDRFQARDGRGHGALPGAGSRPFPGAGSRSRRVGPGPRRAPSGGDGARCERGAPAWPRDSGAGGGAGTGVRSGAGRHRGRGQLRCAGRAWLRCAGPQGGCAGRGRGDLEPGNQLGRHLLTQSTVRTGAPCAGSAGPPSVMSGKPEPRRCGALCCTAMGGPAERVRPRVGTPARAGAPGSGPLGFISARHPEPRGCEGRRRAGNGERE